MRNAPSGPLSQRSHSSQGRTSQREFNTVIARSKSNDLENRERQREFKNLICSFKESENAYYQRNRSSSSYLDQANPAAEENNEE